LLQEPGIDSTHHRITGEYGSLNRLCQMAPIYSHRVSLLTGVNVPNRIAIGSAVFAGLIVTCDKHRRMQKGNTDMGEIWREEVS